MKRASIVVARFGDLVGRRVRVRVGWCADGLVGELANVLPCGKTYFLRLVVDGKPRLINASSALEIEEA